MRYGSIVYLLSLNLRTGFPTSVVMSPEPWEGKMRMPEQTVEMKGSNFAVLAMCFATTYLLAIERIYSFPVNIEFDNAHRTSSIGTHCHN